MKEQITEITGQKSETEKFNFPEIGAIKEDMVSLCRKMKEAIDEGRYTALVSDEVGGRIPTLILRKILRKLHPGKEPRTLFVASGQKSDLPDYEKEKDAEKYKQLVDYLKKVVTPDDYILLVTQHIYSGLTVQKLSVAISDAAQPMKGLDIAATNAFHIGKKELERGVIDSDDEEEEFRTGMSASRRPIIASNIFIGREGSLSTDKMEDRHNRFTGVAKAREYDPSPILYTKSMEKYGKDMNYYSDGRLKKIFGIEEWDSAEIIFTKKWETPENMRKYKEISSMPLSGEEQRQLMEEIKKTREDVDTMSRAILKEVWSL